MLMAITLPAIGNFSQFNPTFQLRHDGASLRESFPGLFSPPIKAKQAFWPDYSPIPKQGLNPVILPLND
jgi:hypothetical protein